MFAHLRAKAALASAAIRYGLTPSEEHEHALRAAFGAVIGRSSEDWSEHDWQEYETARARRPTP